MLNAVLAQTVKQRVVHRGHMALAAKDLFILALELELVMFIQTFNSVL